MCEKHKLFFKNKLTEWKKDLVRTNNEALYNSSLDDNSTSADIVDQASSYTEKNVEMRAINRQIKLISKIDSALKKIKDGFKKHLFTIINGKDVPSYINVTMKLLNHKTIDAEYVGLVASWPYTVNKKKEVVNA